MLSFCSSSYRFFSGSVISLGPKKGEVAGAQGDSEEMQMLVLLTTLTLISKTHAIWETLLQLNVHVDSLRYYVKSLFFLFIPVFVPHHVE
jgi:hypothetical protein